MKMPMKCRGVLIAVLVTLCVTANAQDNLYRMVVDLDYETLIAKSNDFVTQESVPSEKILPAAYAYHFQGRLLMSSYQAALDLSGVYYECRAGKNTRLKQSPFLPFARGVFYAIRNRYAPALESFAEFRKSSKESAWSNKAGVWMGCLNEKMGNRQEAEKIFRTLDWKNPALSGERWMLVSLLGLSTQSVPGSKPAMNAVKDVVDARNFILTTGSLEKLSRAEKVRLFGMFNNPKPMYLLPGKDGIDKYYDLLAFLAAGRCALSISSDLMAVSVRSMNDADHKRYPTIGFLTGMTSFLLGDYETTSRLLANEIGRAHV
jgi:hypothetical protein